MNILVILAAKLITNDLRYKFGDIPSIMLPYEKKPLLFSQYNRYKEFYDRIILILGEGNELVEDYIVRNNFEQMIVIKTQRHSTLKKTLLNIFPLDRKLNIDNLSLLFGDTLVGNCDVANSFGKNIVLTSLVNDSSRWTLLNKNKIIDKDIVDYEPPYEAIIGFFNFKDHSEFLSILKKEDFYNSIYYFSSLYETNYINAKEWIDLGHEDNFLKIKKNNTRSFNYLEIDTARGLVKKTSLDNDKLINEILWYAKLPKEISYLAPRIFEYSLEIPSFILMEYYSHDTLHETYMFSNLSYNEWRKIYINLFSKLSDLEKYKISINKEESIILLEKMYINKVFERIEIVKNNRNFDTLFLNNICINGSCNINLEIILKKYVEVYKILKIDKIDEFSIIHGDYFFSNIIYDRKTNFIKLIDPRGEFGLSGIYGDRRYDYSKLLHSVHGKYNLIVEDMFTLIFSKTSYEYSIFVSDSQRRAEKALIDFIIERGIDINQIKLIEAGLFLSMIPLHEENFQRQLIMLFQGIKILNDLIEELKL
jgi:hypothetical protein